MADPLISADETAVPAQRQQLTSVYWGHSHVQSIFSLLVKANEPHLRQCSMMSKILLPNWKHFFFPQFYEEYERNRAAFALTTSRAGGTSMEELYSEAAERQLEQAMTPWKRGQQVRLASGAGAKPLPRHEILGMM